MATAQQTAPGTLPTDARILASALGGETRVAVLYLLHDSEEPLYQYEIAEALDLSQPAISRAKSQLLTANLIVETNAGIAIPDDVGVGIDVLYRAVRNPGALDV